MNVIGNGAHRAIHIRLVPVAFGFANTYGRFRIAWVVLMTTAAVSGAIPRVKRGSFFLRHDIDYYDFRLAAV
jgi:hypothetical protein